MKQFFLYSEIGLISDEEEINHLYVGRKYKNNNNNFILSLIMLISDSGKENHLDIGNNMNSC